MTKLIPALLAAGVVWLALSLTSFVPAQTELPAPKATEPESTDKPIPEAALLTERGRQLAQELKMLRRTRATLGSKHPTLPLIVKKIEAVEEQLEAWEPAFGTPPPNPFQPQSSRSGSTRMSTSPQMNEYDLRQMVIRLTRRVEELERRVSQLERAARK